MQNLYYFHIKLIYLLKKNYIKGFIITFNFNIIEIIFI